MCDIVIECENLTKFFGTTPAVDHLTLRVPRGCVYGFLGRNGAGKTTAIKLMLGLLHPTDGRAAVLGHDSQSLPPAVRGRIGYVTEGHRLYRRMKIGELERFQRAFFPGRWKGALFNDMLEYLELSRRQKIKSISNGQRAQVSLALAMAGDPELLIMDDPTLGLDAAIRRQFLEGMIQLIQRAGKTILFSSHILGDVERVADRVAVIDRGVLRADCTLDEFRAAVRKVQATFDGDPPDDIDLPGLLHTRRDDRAVELTLIGATDEQVNEWAADVGAASCTFAEMNLEDQFIEFTAPAGGGRLFQWEEA